MAALILVLGDQLTATLPAISDANKSTDTILMAEVREEATYVKHHKKKIAFYLVPCAILPNHFATMVTALTI